MRSIEHLPRVSLGMLPTPLEAAPRLTARIGGPPLYVKRDDLIGLALAGNKVRKLEYVIGDAVAHGADTLITAAGLQSNRARMTVQACRRAGLECVLLLCSNYGLKAPIGNLMLDAIFGADIRFSQGPDSSSPETLAEAEAIAETLRSRGRRAYLTEVGGRPEPLSELGYYLGGLELAEQCRAAGLELGTVLVATGSGGTQAGILLGLRAAGFRTRVVGISLSANDAPSRMARVKKLATELVTWLELDVAIELDDVVVDDSHSQAGHGHPDPASVEAVRVVAQTEGLLIDPIYLGKVVAALPDLVARGLVDGERPAVIWHTGGAVAIFMHPEVFAEDESRLAGVGAAGSA
jgi:1-aminocyclopropane-1-carboxylate deaminase/D-cysteine desulfhydrase-like pyridoxal-dependent ACC family enzyme